ncbi:hypothetical protein ILP92_12990 [Maribius pontilimi]|uniref:Uncharacterized protein n=1 Tax=Palleronia pontilimi TaxID=1964209 RepID=A0A934MEP8_9RHOB|nr:hypothetical protein [Palleronia pontilimi]MBJ3763666.1 hypothetical protein [Palleronia pontilimi]
MIDWGHAAYDPGPEHHIALCLSWIRTDKVIALTERYFDSEIPEEKASRPETGLGRLNDTIRARYPTLTDRDFETQNLIFIAIVKPSLCDGANRTLFQDDPGDPKIVAGVEWREEHKIVGGDGRLEDAADFAVQHRDRLVLGLDAVEDAYLLGIDLAQL